jgi:putative PIN family toxin of toxin-antitoxin system
VIRAVLDTSVLVSAVISPGGPNAQVFDLITAEKILPCVSDVILEEYQRVFSYSRLQHLDPSRVRKLRGLLEAMSKKVRPRLSLGISDHEDDNRIYECAAAAQAHYIVTENTKHFKKPFKTTKIVNARQLLAIMDPGGKSKGPTSS